MDAATTSSNSSPGARTNTTLAFAAITLTAITLTLAATRSGDRQCDVGECDSNHSRYSYVPHPE